MGTIRLGRKVFEVDELAYHWISGWEIDGDVVVREGVHEVALWPVEHREAFAEQYSKYRRVSWLWRLLAPPWSGEVSTTVEGLKRYKRHQARRELLGRFLTPKPIRMGGEVSDIVIRDAPTPEIGLQDVDGFFFTRIRIEPLVSS